MPEHKKAVSTNEHDTLLWKAQRLEVGTHRQMCVRHYGVVFWETGDAYFTSCLGAGEQRDDAAAA